jgi:tRNA-dihydrouridine synthase
MLICDVCCADVNYRQLARLLSRKTVLWTEMVVDKTVIHTNQLDKCVVVLGVQHL